MARVRTVMATTTVVVPLRRLATPVNSAAYWVDLYEVDDPDRPFDGGEPGPVVVLVDDAPGRQRLVRPPLMA